MLCNTIVITCHVHGAKVRNQCFKHTLPHHTNDHSLKFNAKRGNASQRFPCMLNCIDKQHMIIWNSEDWGRETYHSSFTLLLFSSPLGPNYIIPVPSRIFYKRTSHMLNFERPWNAVRSKCKDGSDIGTRQTYSTSNYVSFRQLSTWACCECQGTCSTANTAPLFCLHEEREPIAVLKRGSSCCSGIPQAAIQSKCHPRYTQVLTTAVYRRWHRTQKNRRKRGGGMVSL